MKKRDFKTYHKNFRDFKILTKFFETHVFRGTICHPFTGKELQTKLRKTENINFKFRASNSTQANAVN